MRVQNKGKWFTGFGNGRTNLHDDNLTEQASISRTDVNAAWVEKLMLQKKQWQVEIYQHSTQNCSRRTGIPQGVCALDNSMSDKTAKKKWTYPVYSFKSLPRIHIDRRWDKDVSFHTTKETRLNAVETQFLGRSNLNAWNSVGNLCHLYSRMQKEPSTQNSWLG